MILNHINLGVSEIAPTVAMFETYFGFSRAPGPFDDRMAFLNDESGALISLFKVKDATYPKIFHVGFMRETRQEVRDMHRRLSEDGFAPDHPRDEHGRFTFYFQAPGGFTVEFNSFAPEV